MAKEIYTIEHKAYPRQSGGTTELCCRFRRDEQGILISRNKHFVKSLVNNHMLPESRLKDIYTTSQRNLIHKLKDRFDNDNLSCIYVDDVSDKSLIDIIKFCIENKVSMISYTSIDDPNDIDFGKY